MVKHPDAFIADAAVLGVVSNKMTTVAAGGEIVINRGRRIEELGFCQLSLVDGLFLDIHAAEANFQRYRSDAEA